MQWALSFLAPAPSGAGASCVQRSCIFTHFSYTDLRQWSYCHVGKMVKNKPLTRGKLVKMGETV
ncbi:hypothetical protein CF138_19805 [Aeromonas hydrophila]|nr:hypothetical protein CF138_19805 [Aeromonas hydrophila]TNH95064.1 hypothetical protein CF136_19845 [Aeromonas hydrophila]TNI97063.1 hypothetical protein CF118_08290 [Aeromonas hydrophila]HAU4894880.1 hypothetical protein [Aeromonas hydrophila]HAU4976054.1 hypothetical protein [Aeromonas hydrophila]